MRRSAAEKAEHSRVERFAPSGIARMMAFMQLLGVDLGTSSLKALLVEADGRIVGQGSVEYPILRPEPDHAVQRPDEWWQAAASAVHMALAEVGEENDVAAIGLSGQMHGTILLDESGGLLAPAVIWPDRRSRQQIKELTDLVGAQRLIELTGSPLATGFQVATLRWFQQERPTLWHRVKTIVTPKDYLRWRLTGELGSEPSDGSGTLLLDVRSRDWSAEMLAAIGLDVGLLPTIRPSATIAGLLTRGAANQLGLPAGIPVIHGAADTACGLLGAGVVDEGSLMLTISSGGQLVMPTTKVVTDLNGRMHTFCGALEPVDDQPGWYQMAATLSAGLSLRWLRDQVLSISGSDAYDRMTALAAQAPPGANGLLFLPYLLGERSPHMDPLARGLFLGLTAEHGQPEMIRAVMEGVGLACYDAYEILAEIGAKPTQIIMAGGGARSDLWRQIVADVFGLTVRPVTTSEQAAAGAALLAGGGLGLFEPATTAGEWARYESSVEPDGRANEIYARLLPIFRAAYQKHKVDFADLWSI